MKKAPAKASQPAAKAPVKGKAPAKGKGKAPAKAKGKAVQEDESEQSVVVEVVLTRLNIGYLELSVFVDNGAGSHSLEVSTLDNYDNLITKVSAKMSIPYHCVTMGYEAPWSTKVGQKRRPIYIISEVNLDFFWAQSKRHIDGKEGGKKSKTQVIAELGALITFVNMMEPSNVSLSPFLSYLSISLTLFPARREGGTLVW